MARNKLEPLVVALIKTHLKSLKTQQLKFFSKQPQLSIHLWLFVWEN
jgi:hypothetical protein